MKELLRNYERNSSEACTFLSCLNDCKETFRQCLESSRGKRRILDPKPYETDHFHPPSSVRILLYG